MNIDSLDLYSLHIPFRFDFIHAQAKRMASDSFVIKLTLGDECGYGEAIVRDYVSGTVGEGAALPHICETAVRLIEAVPELSLKGIRKWSRETVVEHRELPVLCAIESALLDLACGTRRVDIYELLETEPERNEMIYGGTLPMLPPDIAAQRIDQSKKLGIRYLRLKLGSDLEFNREILTIARQRLGDEFDLRIDANAAWDIPAIYEHLDLLREYGVSHVEEPLGRNQQAIKECVGNSRSAGITFVADESILTMDDLRQISEEKTFGMLNLRLSKNGGILRCLDIADAADALGIRYQLGCLVGETGVLSAGGRVAASLMKNPVYIDGSYDRILLSENITEDDMYFGPGGRAKVIRNNGLGFRVSPAQLEKLRNDYRRCI